MTRAAIAAGADGLMLEIHANPEAAWSDGYQALNPGQFIATMESSSVVAGALGRMLG
jgi:3-deoxy-7-phosphoheptulonate synthase